MKAEPAFRPKDLLVGRGIPVTTTGSVKPVISVGKQIVVTAAAFADAPCSAPVSAVVPTPCDRPINLFGITVTGGASVRVIISADGTLTASSATPFQYTVKPDRCKPEQSILTFFISKMSASGGGSVVSTTTRNGRVVVTINGYTTTCERGEGVSSICNGIVTLTSGRVLDGKPPPAPGAPVEDLRKQWKILLAPSTISEFQCSGGSNLNFRCAEDWLDATELAVSASESGNIAIDADTKVAAPRSVDTVQVTASGASNIKFSSMITKGGVVSASGASKVTGLFMERGRCQASGASKVVVRAETDAAERAIRTHESGTSKVTVTR